LHGHTSLHGISGNSRQSGGEIILGKIFDQTCKQHLLFHLRHATSTYHPSYQIQEQPCTWNLYGFNHGYSIEKNILKGEAYREDLLLRQFNTDTQTKKSRIERWENVADAFQLHEATSMQDKHILLIDDVITTGASTDACAEILLQKKAASVSICSLAYTI